MSKQSGAAGGLTLEGRIRDLRPGILLDRDGRIIVDHGYVGSVDFILERIAA